MSSQASTAVNEYKNPMIPSVGFDGEWRTSGALALQQSLRLGSATGVTHILDSLDLADAADALREVGFNVSNVAVKLGRQTLMSSVQTELNAALAAQVDGYGLKKIKLREKPTNQRSAESPVHDFETSNASLAIQRLMKAGDIEVSLFGTAPLPQRGSLQFIAGQALKQHVQGFGFEGLDGKYTVDATLPDMVKLHEEAARNYAQQTARMALTKWARGEKISAMTEWIPESVQRLLMNSLSVDSAVGIVQSIKSEVVGQHASEYGAHGFATIMADQGFDVNAKTISMQAEELGLEIVEPDRQRGQYIGQSVGQDHRSALLKFNRNQALELPFAAIAEGQLKPAIGDRVRMGFKNEILTVSVAPLAERTSVSR